MEPVEGCCLNRTCKSKFSSLTLVFLLHCINQSIVKIKAKYKYLNLTVERHQVLDRAGHAVYPGHRRHPHRQSDLPLRPLGVEVGHHPQRRGAHGVTNVVQAVLAYKKGLYSHSDDHGVFIIALREIKMLRGLQLHVSLQIFFFYIMDFFYSVR